MKSDATVPTFYNGKDITLNPDDLYIYSPGMPVTILSAINTPLRRNIFTVPASIL